MVLGRLTHYAFDAVLLSAFLAGVKRSTGLTYVDYPLVPASQVGQHHIKRDRAVMDFDISRDR
ncbi:hypothetical protein B9Z65_264 [Elsinoe australis]|uniref:DUF1748-domain-containing protein n=1 Tax=Elsinoe australis TaxID=40998 RepID=A0A2P7ZQ27_9PEZI|nr:hypothetical protein B9Z65_264 [Elsinoe australis]